MHPLLLPALAAATIAPGWTEPVLPFGDVPALQNEAGAAMAHDGRIVFARIAPDGALEVRERPPGGPVGPPLTVTHDAAHLHVLVGVDGTAAVLFDAHGERFAWVPGHDPQPLGPAGEDPGAEAVTSNGEVWRVAPAADGRLALYRTAGEPILLPSPSVGGSDTAPALAVPRAGGAHVVYIEQGATAQDGSCVGKTVLHAVDISAAGIVSPRATLDSFTATGAGTAVGCAFDDGTLIEPPLLATTDARGADTVVYGTREFPSLAVTAQARHRDPGGAWPGEAEPIAAGIPEALVGDRGLPLLVLRPGSVTSRRPDGTWTTPAPLGNAPAVQAARTGMGTTILSWAQDGQILARVAGADGTLGALTELATAADGSRVLAAGGDDEGNGVALFSRPRGDAFELDARGYDAAGPRITGINAPSDGPAGEPLTFEATGVDVWSPTAVHWDFGDGQSSEGGSVRHIYADPGGRVVTVSLRDPFGNSTEAFLGLEVTDALPAPHTTPAPQPSVTPTPSVPPPAPDTRAPRLALRRGHGRTLVVTTDEPGRLALTLTRGKHHRSLSLPLAVGTRRVTLPRLAAGKWTVAATITDAAGNRSHRATLRISAPRVPQRR